MNKIICPDCGMHIASKNCNTCVSMIDNNGRVWTEDDNPLTGTKSLPYTNSVQSEQASIPIELYQQLEYLGIIDSGVRDTHVGASDYSKQLIQPWTIWLAYPNLTSWDHDILKRILRNKSTDSRKLDYQKIMHICAERIRQIDTKESHGKHT